MKTDMRRQQGITLMTGIIVVAILMFFVLLGMKLVPTYLEHHSIKTSIGDMEREPRIRQQSIAKIREIIRRKLKVNSVYDFDMNRNMSIKKRDGRIHIEVKYEVRKNMAGNIDAVMSFHDKFVL